MSTLVVFILSIISLFLLGFINYYVPDEEDAIAMQFMRDRRNNEDDDFDEECVIMSHLRFGVLIYVLLSLIALAITLVAYFTCDYKIIRIMSDYGLIMNIVMIVLHVVMFFIVACIYTIMPFLGEYFQRWKTSMFYENYFGVKIFDGVEENEE